MDLLTLDQALAAVTASRTSRREYLATSGWLDDGDLDEIESIEADFAARYQDGDHCVDGDRGASEWTLSGTTLAGERIEVRGCDLWTFRDGQVVKKDSFWKIRTSD